MREIAGDSWATQLARVMGVTPRMALYIAEGKHVPHRRKLILLQTWLRQKRNASSSRLAQKRAAAERQLRRENEGAQAFLAWIETELAKKK